MTTQSPPPINWVGASGKSYIHYSYPIDIDFGAKPGNYIFARWTGSTWVPLYIGQTEDLSNRFDNHHKIDLAKRHGATHIHAHANENGERARLAEETDLVKKWNPACNG